MQIIQTEKIGNRGIAVVHLRDGQRLAFRFSFHWPPASGVDGYGGCRWSH